MYFVFVCANQICSNIIVLSWVGHLYVFTALQAEKEFAAEKLKSLYGSQTSEASCVMFSALMCELLCTMVSISSNGALVRWPPWISDMVRIV